MTSLVIKMPYMFPGEFTHYIANEMPACSFLRLFQNAFDLSGDSEYQEVKCL